jgi:hypothetical protein
LEEIKQRESDMKYKQTVCSLAAIVCLIFLWASSAVAENTESGSILRWSGPLSHFVYGVIGALAMYLFAFKTERLGPALRSVWSESEYERTESGFRRVVPEYKLLIFDLGIAILLGGFVAVLVTQGGTPKESILLGCTWNSFLARLYDRDK